MAWVIDKWWWYTEKLVVAVSRNHSLWVTLWK